MVRHPKGSVLLKAGPDPKTADIVPLPNGSPVEIIRDSQRWYKVRASGFTGYLHHTWVRVDQYDATPGLLRLIQIKSFASIDNALAYAEAIPIPVSVFLATNGWYAVTIARLFELDDALDMVKALKQEGHIPDDSFVTLGNTYVLKLCCAQETHSAYPTPTTKPFASYYPSSGPQD